MRIRPAFRALSIALFLWGIVLAPVHAQDAIKYVDISEHRSGNHVEVRMRNLTTAEQTVTIEFDVESNVELSPSCPLTRVLPGGAEEQMVSVYLPRDNRRWQYHFKYSTRVGNLNARHDSNAVYQLPFAHGQSCAVLQGFGGTFSHQGDEYNAIDFKMPEGTEVHAARGGEVVLVVDRFREGAPDRSLLERSNRVIVRHPDGTCGAYAHLRPGGAAVHAGDRVKAGDLLGWSSNTGFTSTPHLHFIVFRPLDGHHTESIPIRYVVAGEPAPIELQKGKTYTPP